MLQLAVTSVIVREPCLCENYENFVIARSCINSFY